MSSPVALELVSRSRPASVPPRSAAPTGPSTVAPDGVAVGSTARPARPAAELLAAFIVSPR